MLARRRASMQAPRARRWGGMGLGWGVTYPLEETGSVAMPRRHVLFHARSGGAGCFLKQRLACTATAGMRP